MTLKHAKSSLAKQPGTPTAFHRVLKLTLKPIAFTAGLLARLWARKFSRQHVDPKPPRKSRREEKQRRKELRRATGTAGRRRAA